MKPFSVDILQIFKWGFSYMWVRSGVFSCLQLWHGIAVWELIEDHKVMLHVSIFWATAIESEEICPHHKYSLRGFFKECHRSNLKKTFRLMFCGACDCGCLTHVWPLTRVRIYRVLVFLCPVNPILLRQNWGRGHLHPTKREFWSNSRREQRPWGRWRTSIKAC